MEKQYPSQVADRVLVRLPEGMKEVLSARAKAEHRSVGREALMLIERGLAAEKTTTEHTA